MFGEGLFWAAFARAGMLVDVVYQPVSGPAVPFKAGFERPDQVVLDGTVHTTGYRIEYQASDVELKRNYEVTIGAERFRVIQPPMAAGDGSFFKAALEKVQA